MRASLAVRDASASPDSASSSRTRSVSIRDGRTPTTRTPRGPSSSASDLAKPARPGRSPLEIVRPAIGSCTDPDSTKPMTPPSPSASAAVRARRTAPRKTDSNADCHWSSVLSARKPGAGPPTLIRMPSSLPKRSFAASTSRRAASGSALSAPSPTASAPSSAAASTASFSSRPEMTTFAPSAARARAVALPSPRVAPVTMYTRSFSPRSMVLSCQVLTGEVDRAVHQTDVAERLRVVAELAPGRRVVLLGEQSHVVAQVQQPVEERFGLVPAARPQQGVHEPERAREERPLVAGKAVHRAVLGAVAADQAVVGQPLAHRVDRADHPGVVGRQEAGAHDEQRRGVELPGSVVLGERVAYGVVPLLEDLRVHGVPHRPPPVGVPRQAGVLLQGAHRPVGRDPGHHLGVDEVPAFAAHLPEALVRLTPAGLQEAEQTELQIPGVRLVVESGGAGHPERVDDLAVHVELELAQRRVARADRQRV